MKKISLPFLLIIAMGLQMLFFATPSYASSKHTVASIEKRNSSASFKRWLKRGFNRRRAIAYENYLIKHLGRNNVPRMEQMLLTARSWRQCRQSQYQVPPRYLWHKMLPTLRLYVKLKRRGILPRDTYVRSTYRNPRLNSCAGGARRSSHRANSAVDIWSPSFHSRRVKRRTQNKICKFWRQQGRRYNFGLGIYRTGSIHIDATEYRMWGKKHTMRWSYCRR